MAMPRSAAARGPIRARRSACLCTTRWIVFRRARVTVVFRG